MIINWHIALRSASNEYFTFALIHLLCIEVVYLPVVGSAMNPKAKRRLHFTASASLFHHEQIEDDVRLTDVDEHFVLKNYAAGPDGVNVD